MKFQVEIDTDFFPRVYGEFGKIAQVIINLMLLGRLSESEAREVLKDFIGPDHEWFSRQFYSLISQAIQNRKVIALDIQSQNLEQHNLESESESESESDFDKE